LLRRVYSEQASGLVFRDTSDKRRLSILVRKERKGTP